MYMQARYYDPVIGRFYSNDPVGMTNVHTFNRYAYANNNPYKYVDPDGKAVVFSSEAAKSNFYASMNYLSGKSSIAKASFHNILSKNTPTVEISIGKNPIMTDATPDSNAKITFNPKQGMTFKGGSQSPATGLLHEIIHVELQNSGKDMSKGLEGAKTIEKENTVNAQTGEGTRSVHNEIDYKVDKVSGPTCRSDGNGGETCG